MYLNHYLLLRDREGPFAESPHTVEIKSIKDEKGGLYLHRDDLLYLMKTMNMTELMEALATLG